MNPYRRASLAMIVGVFLGPACYIDPDLNKIACQPPEYECPDGFLCVTTRAGTGGRCEKAIDASPVDLFVSNIDTSATEAETHPTVLTPSVADGGQASEILTPPDAWATSDLPTDPVIIPGLVTDVAPDQPLANPDLPAHEALDLAVDAERDLVPDLRPDSGPDAAPDERSGLPPDVCGTASDPRNCGSCGHDCTQLPHVRASAVSCQDGICVVPSASCVSGYAHCSANPDDGCETSIRTTSNCGACGQPCSVRNGTGSCSTGTCRVNSCSSGFGDCDTLLSNGCEQGLLSDLNHCGGCNLHCLPNSTCLTGACRTKLGYPVKDCAMGLAAYQDYLFGFSISVPTAGTLLGFGAIPYADGTWNFGLYTDTGGQPGRLVSTTGDVTLVAYGNALEFPVNSTAIAAGTYWLMSVRRSTSGSICLSAGPSIDLWQTVIPTGSLPDPFPVNDPNTMKSYQNTWNVYVNLQLPGT